MSGHSKWKQIKRQKAVTDSQRARVFTKMARIISVAARKGADPEINAELRMAIERAKYENMPKDNIERAIKKGAGTEGGEGIEQAEYEAFGPAGIMFIIKVLTDNKNRTVGEIKNILSKNSGRLGEIGSVKWMFEKKGVLEIKKGSAKNEEVELLAIEAGAEDVKEKDDILEVYTKPEDFNKTRKALEQKGLALGNVSLDWVAKAPIEVKDEKTKEQVMNLLNLLDEQDDVEEIYSNLVY